MMRAFNEKGKISKSNIGRKAFLAMVIASSLIVGLLTGCGSSVKDGATVGSNATELYQINTETFKQDSIVIEYPQIEGLGNDSVEKELNALIKNDILKSQVEETIKSYQVDGGAVKLNVDLKYQVTMSTAEMLSVVYTGTSYMEGGMYVNNVFYGITLDLTKGSRQSLADFDKIDADLILEIKESKNVTNEAVKSVDNEKQADEIRSLLMNEIQSQENNDILLALENNKTNNFYVTKDGLVICIGVSSAAGDYVLVEVPRQ